MGDLSILELAIMEFFKVVKLGSRRKVEGNKYPSQKSGR